MPEYRIIKTHGSQKEVEKTLNEQATEGYFLDQIVDRSTYDVWVIVRRGGSVDDGAGSLPACVAQALR